MTDSVVVVHLEFEEDIEFILFVWFCRAGGEPLAVDRAWVPLTYGASLFDVDWFHIVFYVEMTRIGAPTPTAGWERLAPVIPPPADRNLLDLPSGAAAFSLERLGMRDGKPVEWRTTLIRGDRYRFVSEWSPAGGGSMLRPSA